MRVYQGKIEIVNVRELLARIPEGCVLINADYVVDIESVKFAAEKALKLWNSGKRVAKTLSMEILLHVAATRQISQATRIGIKDGENRVVVVDLNDCRSVLDSLGFREQNVLEMNDDKIRRIADFYGISEEELKIAGAEKLGLLVRERMALFAISK